MHYEDEYDEEYYSSSLWNYEMAFMEAARTGKVEEFDWWFDTLEYIHNLKETKQ